MLCLFRKADMAITNKEPVKNTWGDLRSTYSGAAYLIFRDFPFTFWDFPHDSEEDEYSVGLVVDFAPEIFLQAEAYALLLGIDFTHVPRFEKDGYKSVLLDRYACMDLAQSIVRHIELSGEVLNGDEPIPQKFKFEQNIPYEA